jgi:hypothetical protein
MWKAPNDDVYVGKTICNRLIGLVMLMSWGDLKVFHTKALLRLRPGRPALMLEQPSTSDSSEQIKLMIRKTITPETSESCMARFHSETSIQENLGVWIQDHGEGRVQISDTAG